MKRSLFLSVLLCLYTTAGWTQTTDSSTTPEQTTNTGQPPATESQPATADNEQGQTRYIRDDLFIYMHTGPGREFRIIGTVQAGTKVTVLKQDDDKGFAEIIDNEKRKGWVEQKQVVTTRSMREVLPETEQKLTTAQQQLDQAQQLNAQLTQQMTDLKETNKQLQQRFNTLNDTYTLLQKQQDSQDQRVQRAWFTRGGLVALGGIILGVIITYIPKRRRRQDNWM